MPLKMKGGAKDGVYPGMVCTLNIKQKRKMEHRKRKKAFVCVCAVVVVTVVFALIMSRTKISEHFKVENTGAKEGMRLVIFLPLAPPVQGNGLQAAAGGLEQE